MQLRKFHVTLQQGDNPYQHGEVAGIAYGDPATPVEIMFLHANGFNGVTYQSILQPLAQRAHVAAMDFRGHGLTMLPTNANKLRSWNVLRDDVIATIERSAPYGLVLGGHSMGATVALEVAARAPHLVHGLVLADPVILSPGLIRLLHLPLLGRLARFNKLATRARNRKKTRFASREEAEAYFEGRGSFSTWRPPFLHDYLIDGLTWVADQNFELSCQPEWEAACFSAHANRPWSAFHSLGLYRDRALSRSKRLGRMNEAERLVEKSKFDEEFETGNMSRSRIAKTIPVIILQAEKDSTAVEDLDVRVHNVMPDAAVTRIPGTTHFLPMERPYVVRDALDILYRTWRGEFEEDYVGAVKRTINDSIGIMG